MVILAKTLASDFLIQLPNVSAAVQGKGECHSMETCNVQLVHGRTVQDQVKRQRHTGKGATTMKDSSCQLPKHLVNKTLGLATSVEIIY